MKKSLLLFAVLALVFGCQNKSVDTPSPISNILMPQSSVDNPIIPGSSVAIQGGGFDASSQVVLRAVATKSMTLGATSDVPVENIQVNPSGITFTAPLVYGAQAVILKQSAQEFNLGTLTFPAQTTDSLGDNYFKYPNSTLSEAAVKTNINNVGIDLMQALQGLSTSKAYRALTTLSSLPPADFSQNSSSNSDPISTIIHINSFYGKYTWNADSSIWILSPSTDKLILEFPSTLDGKTNNARIEVTGVPSTAVTSGYEVPNKLDAIIYVDNANEGAFHVTATDVSASSYANSVNVNVTLGTYVFDMVSNKGTNNQATFTVKNGETVLINAMADLTARGDHFYAPGADSLIDSSNVQMQIMNDYVIAGNMDIQAVNRGMAALNATYSDSARGKAYEDARVALINKNTQSILVSRLTQTRACNLILRTRENKNYWGPSYESTPAFQFPDNTLVDTDVFFGSGFDTMYSAWTNFLTKFN